MKYYCLLIVTVILLPLNIKAQLVGNNVFLQARFLEVGMGHLGYYGSDSSAPAGYHYHTTGVSTLVPMGIGFVTDVPMDGWTVGTPPMMGDYFLPGSPFEGWELQINGRRCQGFNFGPASTFQLSDTSLAISGGVSAYNTSGGITTGIYQVTIDSVVMTQETILDTNNLYFTTKVTLFNLSATPRDSIYYLRTLDPDNDATWSSIGGRFYTFNKIEHQSIDTTVVSATGVSSAAPYMALGSTYTNANCLIYRNWPLSTSVDLESMHNQTYSDPGVMYMPGDTVTNDYALGISFFVPHLASVDSAGDSVLRTTSMPGLHPANSATFSFFYAFSPAARDLAITRGLGMTPTAIHTKNITTGNDVHAYPNPSGAMVNVTGLRLTDHIALYDMTGKHIDRRWKITKDGTNTFSLNNLPAGAYLLVVTGEEGNITASIPIRKQ